MSESNQKPPSAMDSPAVQASIAHLKTIAEASLNNPAYAEQYTADLRTRLHQSVDDFIKNNPDFATPIFKKLLLVVTVDHTSKEIHINADWQKLDWGSLELKLQEKGLAPNKSITVDLRETPEAQAQRMMLRDTTPGIYPIREVMLKKVPAPVIEVIDYAVENNLAAFRKVEPKGDPGEPAAYHLVELIHRSVNQEQQDQIREHFTLKGYSSVEFKERSGIHGLPNSTSVFLYMGFTRARSLHARLSNTFESE